ncbi:MAG: YceI family protein [Solirubrobacteraceae bacterium]
MTSQPATGIAATEVQIPAPGSYRIEPAASSITFATRHMFGLAAVNGSFAFASGEITITEPDSTLQASAAIDASSFKTANARRDKDVRSPKFLHVQAHPEITFRSSRLGRDGDTWLLEGELTVAGNAAPVALRISSLVADATGLSGQAAARLDRYDHAITKMKGMAGRYLDLEITIRATRV